MTKVMLTPLRKTQFFCLDFIRISKKKNNTLTGLLDDKIALLKKAQGNEISIGLYKYR